MPPTRYVYAVQLEDASGDLVLEDGSGLLALEVSSIVLVNYLSIKVGNGMSVSERIR